MPIGGVCLGAAHWQRSASPHIVSLALLAPVRAMLTVSLVGASFTSAAVVGDRGLPPLPAVFDRSAPEAVQHVAAGGFSLSAPDAWERMSTVELASDARARRGAAAEVVGGICPGGRAGSGCRGGVAVTFVSYPGGRQASLPPLAALERRFDRSLAGRLPGFRKLDAKIDSTAPGDRWVRYSYDLGRGRSAQRQVLGAFRHQDGSGLVVVATGPALGMRRHGPAILRFLRTGTEDGGRSGRPAS